MPVSISLGTDLAFLMKLYHIHVGRKIRKPHRDFRRTKQWMRSDFFAKSHKELFYCRYFFVFSIITIQASTILSGSQIYIPHYFPPKLERFTNGSLTVQ